MQSERGAPVLPKYPDGNAYRPVVAPAGELEDLLAAQTRHFSMLDVKALGFVSYLRNTAKQDVITLLGQLGIAAGVAKNSLERLALVGLITDTGHNYIAVEGREAEIAGQFVEPEMIQLTGLGE